MQKNQIIFVLCVISLTSLCHSSKTSSVNYTLDSSSAPRCGLIAGPTFSNYNSSILITNESSSTLTMTGWNMLYDDTLTCTYRLVNSNDIENSSDFKYLLAMVSALEAIGQQNVVFNYTCDSTKYPDGYPSIGEYTNGNFINSTTIPATKSRMLATNQQIFMAVQIIEGLMLGDGYCDMQFIAPSFTLESLNVNSLEAAPSNCSKLTFGGKVAFANYTVNNKYSKDGTMQIIADSIQGELVTSDNSSIATNVSLICDAYYYIPGGSQSAIIGPCKQNSTEALTYHFIATYLENGDITILTGGTNINGTFEKCVQVLKWSNILSVFYALILMVAIQIFIQLFFFRIFVNKQN